jgi:hypothetical protein
MAKKGWTIGKTRSALYKTARILGDINAVKRGTIGQRAINRTVGKVSGRVTGKVSRSIWKIFK